jgi:hypothetical protein
MWHNKIMPKGPQGQKRPGDVIGCAVMVARIATGEIKEEISGRRKGGLRGAEVRAEKLPAITKKKIAEKAARIRWKIS